MLAKNKKEIGNAPLLLQEQLSKHFKFNKSRMWLIAVFVIAMIQVCTVNLAKIANVIPGKANQKSRYRRLQRFFLLFNFSKDCIAKFVVSLLPMNKFILSIDRTNWKWGKKEY